jgi:aspartyl-tRNA(Asn)/glutamyl-tRNA(Gln) amidotransferase subunit B
MPNPYDQYETIIGLEVHAQLLTKSKLFCGDSTAYGAEPNSSVSPITLGHPGTLPALNKKAIEFAIKMGLACHCEIVRENYFARKNYFYPDLPKGYQISQHTTPVCKGGFIPIQINQDVKQIRLNRIHLEEDAGKSLHDMDAENTCLDFNRAGTPLIEIVTEPDLRSGEEAYVYLTELRKLVRYLEICDGNMEEGSLRCDANISVRRKGETKLGTKVEVKNLNSIRNVRRAIEFESRRLMDCLENGENISQQTRSFDAGSNTTFSIREKEDADDYRYFPEPDLPAFYLQDDFIESIRKTIPVLQQERIRKYIREWGLSAYDATVLTEEKDVADYFESVIQHTVEYKAAANWMLGPVKSWLNESNAAICDFPVSPQKLAALIDLVESGRLSFSIASTKIISGLIQDPADEPLALAEKMNLLQQSDISVIEPVVDAVLNKLAEKVKEYKKGKKGLLALFVGEVMKLSRGKADPVMVNELILKKLQS